MTSIDPRLARCWPLLGALLLGASPALGLEPAEIEAAAREELLRSASELNLPDAAPLYHLRYHLIDARSVDVAAAYGVPLYHTENPASRATIELRVGTPQDDNTGFVGGSSGFGELGLPAVLTPDALRLTLWRLTDMAYKAAVQQFANKRAEYAPPPDHPGDFQLTGPVVYQRPGHHPLDGDALVARVVALSGAISPGVPLEGAQVRGYQATGDFWTLDTEGSVVLRPTEELGIRAMAYARAEDGLLLSDHRSWFGRALADLPSPEEMADAVAEMAQRLADLRAAPRLTEEYVGPVVFEDEAAVDLFRYLLLPQVEGTPQEASGTGGRGIFGQMGGGGGDVRLKRRVLPPGWSVVDDPQRVPGHVAAFTHDDEGTPTQKVQLIEDGIVQSVLMSRVPRRGLDGTNGHARTDFSGRAQGRAMMMEVTPGKRTSSGKLYKEGLKLARAYGRDYVIVVRRLQDPPVRGLADFASRVSLFAGSDGEATLPMPVYVVRRYKDGHEEPLRGAAFVNVQRFTLRDIALAGPQAEATFLSSLDPSGVAADVNSGFPTWMSAPEVLVGELELVPVSGDPKDLGIIPRP